MCVKMQVVIKMSTVIGTRIKESRKAAGYPTQGALATALRTHYGLKTDRPMVSKWESGRQVPEMYTIKCISELCSVSTDYLCGKEEKPASISGSELSADEAIKIYSSLSVAQKEKAKDYLRYLKAQEDTH